MTRHFLAWAALFCSAAVSAEAASPLAIEVGESRGLSADAAIRRVVVEREGIVSTSAPSSRQIRITGVSPGQTGLTVETARGRQAYEVEVRPSGAAAARAITEALRADPELGEITAEPGLDGPVLTGTVPNLAAQIRAGELANTLTEAEIKNLAEVQGRQVVAVDVRFVAVSDTTLKALGFNFGRFGQGFEWALVGPNNLTDFEMGGNGLSITAAEPLRNAFNLLLQDRNDGVLGVLSALSEAGLSHVLAQPTLLVRSGESAEFLAGGDVPVPVPQAGGGATAITVEYRPYGVRLAVEPYVLSEDRIFLKIAPEVSELDYANGVTLQGFNIPGFRRRSANTTVELGNGQSFVIAGLTYASGDNREQRLPGLGDLPVIGTLFKRAQHSREKLELIIVATPRLVSPMNSEELADLGDPPPAPSLAETLLNLDTVESRAARVGLSR